MANDFSNAFESLMSRADEYHRNGLWQEKLRIVQDALDMCSSLGSHDAEQYRQQALYELGGIWRRLCQYYKGIKTLESALQIDSNPIMRARIKGELGVVYRHMGHFVQAQRTFSEQAALAQSTHSVEGEIEVCRAVGNEGMSFYNQFQQTRPADKALLQTAFDKIVERIDRAEKLHTRLLKERPDSKYVQQSLMWMLIGMQRLSLCHIAAGRPDEAVKVAEQFVMLNRDGLTAENKAATMRGLSLLFYGNALLAGGHRMEALHVWSSGKGASDPAVSLCKEPTAEHTEYLKLMADAHTDFSRFDDQGFSALDYAVLSDNEDAHNMVKIIEDSSRSLFVSRYRTYVPKLSDQQVLLQVESELNKRRAQANLRRFYRQLLQEEIRPELRRQYENPVSNIRRIYARSMEQRADQQSVLDWFYYVDYRDFKTLHRLPFADEYRPESNEKLARRMHFLNGDKKTDALFIVFFSYRWIGMTSEPQMEGPDDINNTQYGRMIAIMERLLHSRQDLSPERVGIWLDCACISQRQIKLRERGINSLPLAVMQCDVLISLVDPEYYGRAWCAVEVMLVQELQRSYLVHEWYEHILHAPESDRINGVLRAGDMSLQLDISGLALSQEELDRPKVEFLMRQSKLLGRDNSYTPSSTAQEKLI